MKYNSVLDLHTHTIVSGHAYSTLREMAKAASDKGLELLGITEHAPKMPGTCHLFYFDNLRIVPRELYGIELVLGVTAALSLWLGRLKGRMAPPPPVTRHGVRPSVHRPS